ncbi:MAG TPA: hypothetical protein PKU80_12675 [Candidatus Limiplasma sp.]|nr:hypothetical protein [Candidatus Limiplasma sp.]
MKQVQLALAGIGIPVFVGIWKATPEQPIPPSQYAVYSTTTMEAFHHDDRVIVYKTFVYLNLWSETDPTAMAAAIRSAMYAAGFAMIEETDRSGSRSAYNADTRQYTIQWTWCLREEVA